MRPVYWLNNYEFLFSVVSAQFKCSTLWTSYPFLKKYWFDYVGFSYGNVPVFAGVGAGGEEQEATTISIFHLPWLAFIVVILFVGTFSYAPSDIVLNLLIMFFLLEVLT